MDNLENKKVLKKFLDKADAQQEIGPFTTRDTSIMEELHKKLDDNAVNYDNEPVTACPYCHELWLIDVEVDGEEGGKLECFNCGNELQEKDVIIYKSIFSYLHETSKDKDKS